MAVLWSRFPFWSLAWKCAVGSVVGQWGLNTRDSIKDKVSLSDTGEGLFDTESPVHDFGLDPHVLVEIRMLMCAIL